jgi:uncharacterized protein (UPF0333 family)
MKRTTLLLLFPVVLLLASSAWAGVASEAWTRTYNSAKDHQYVIPWTSNNTVNTDYATRTAIDSKGNIIVVGYKAGDVAHAYNGYAMKHDRWGNVI